MVTQVIELKDIKQGKGQWRTLEKREYLSAEWYKDFANIMYMYMY